MSENLIAGFLKGRNLILRGDLYRIIQNLEKVCDSIFYLDDASYDGTYEWMLDYLGEDQVIRVPMEDHNFANELYYKEKLLQLIHKDGPWGWILWQDSDEVLDAKGTAELRQFCEKQLSNQNVKGFVFKYCQLWRNTSWARTDDGFDDGNFLKLWRYEPNLNFEIVPGTHHRQFPIQLALAWEQGKVQQAPWEVIHYGNVGQNLKFKSLQYYGGLGGVDRHLRYEKASYRPVDPATLPPDAEIIPSDAQPLPYTPEQISRIEQMQNLTKLDKTFCVVIPTFNRADYLKRTLDSIRSQTYDKWICVVLDDGSTDDTPYLVQAYLEADPRFFYCRYLEHKGGVAINEIGMDIACNTAEYWVRLGSDDWFNKHKLAYDATAFASEKTAAVYGPFQAHRQGQFGEICNLPIPSARSQEILRTPGAFMASWANVAARTSLLAEIKKCFGNYVDPRLMNMEDAQFNFRVSLFTPWVWRGKFRGELIIDPSTEMCQVINNIREGVEAEAYWNVNDVGASANSHIYAQDRALTDQLIPEDLKRFQTWRAKK